ncbi:MAG: universal stress protein [Planctomycetota bacterium]|nr:universal stress protein [Planctomycetota bacterium]
MYEKILVTLDATSTDKVILDHIRPLARILKSRLILLHVADGWAARTHGADAVSPEVNEDRAYLDRMRAELASDGFEAEAKLAFGDPVTEIVRWVKEEGCDLIAMTTHGHRLLGDIFLGTTASRVQHRVDVPVLLLRAPAEK